jgi:glucose/arabinose dehydrogenase
MRNRIKTGVGLCVLAILCAGIPVAQADIFIKKDKPAKEQKNQTGENESFLRRIFIWPSKEEKEKPKTEKKVSLRPVITGNAAPQQQTIYPVGELKIPKDFDTRMLSASGPEPQTERDLRLIADIKKQAQLIDLQKRRLARQQAR